MSKEVVVREGLAVCMEEPVSTMSAGLEGFAKGSEYKFQEMVHETKIGGERISIRRFKLFPNEDFPGYSESCHPEYFYKCFTVKG